MDESVFLPGEETPVGVRIVNLSGRPMRFGTETNWLTFHVETKQGELVEELAPVPVLGEFLLESAKAATKWWNIQPYFLFQDSGRYSVSVELRIPEWDQRLLSDGTRFTVLKSRSMWETTFGVPPRSGDPDSAPELRRYALIAAARHDGRRLYAELSEATDPRLRRVLMLDRLLSFSSPEQQMDAANQLHVLFQTGGSAYTYCVLTPNGEFRTRQRYEILPGTRPHLVKKPDGTISVADGRRVPSLIDIPPYTPAPPSLTGSNAPVVTPVPSSSSKQATPRNRSRSRRERQPAGDANT